jgi:hypothetical protein
MPQPAMVEKKSLSSSRLSTMLLMAGILPVMIRQYR